MPRNTIELEFADGKYLFALPLPRIDELQRKTGVGIGALFARVLKGCAQVGDDIVQAPSHAEFHALDLIETIRQGLIGGGRGEVDGAEVKVTPVLAQRLIDNYVNCEPLAEAWAVAAAVLGAAVVGYDEPKKKADNPNEATGD